MGQPWIGAALVPDAVCRALWRLERITATKQALATTLAELTNANLEEDARAADTRAVLAGKPAKSATEYNARVAATQDALADIDKRTQMVAETARELLRRTGEGDTLTEPAMLPHLRALAGEDLAKYVAALEGAAAARARLTATVGKVAAWWQHCSGVLVTNLVNPAPELVSIPLTAAQFTYDGVRNVTSLAIDPTAVAGAERDALAVLLKAGERNGKS
jgi:hypothetical protein